ncbi:MAG TPA: vanadium-dependent haloperoxidase [Acidimicrobiia bacterium]|nr:vanadium-dependent haloperoxidase [Acidimicrobiia bacterium]
MSNSRPNRLVRWIATLLALGLVAGGCSGGALDEPECPPIAEHPEWSVARRWNEVLLDAIRRDLPAPTVHARNLYHTSAAMWDAWAAYDPGARGVFVDEEQTASNVDAAREEAISYAAFRVLEARYLDSVGATETIPEFDRLMEDLCYSIDITTTEGDMPAALGNRIARVILDAGMVDGSNEAEGYASPGYDPVNPPLSVDASGTTLIDPNRWQPLQIQHMISQNGIELENGVQESVDPHWGHVVGFALPPAGESGVPIDPGEPPYVHDPETDQEYKDAAVEVVGYSSVLDPTFGVMVDISPATLGDNPLGTNDGTGYGVNPVTGAPYEPNVVNQGDFGRTIAEFWADGPHSETPPGHWNTVANAVTEELGDNLRIGGTGELVDALEWDVKLYLALNGANHDAAIAAWGAKGYYDYIRPISMIRWMGGNGQSSDPDGPSYSVDGLPLQDGLVEVITAGSTTPGERHAALAGHEGEISVLSYAGNPSDPETEIGGVEWILAADWVPYQAPTFVTPSFSGYVSGHSTFSRASAEVLTGIAGSEFFPGGLGEWAISADALKFEAGTENGVTLQWATYQDASDQAGLSRLYGGIHVRADDFAGRKIGAEVGQAAWRLAQTYYGDGSE